MNQRNINNKYLLIGKLKRKFRLNYYFIRYLLITNHSICISLYKPMLKKLNTSKKFNLV